MEKLWDDFIEYIFLDKFRDNNYYVEVFGDENLNSVINNNKPVIFISGHFANFELMSMELTKIYLKLETFY